MARRAFTLIELLVVMLIIALLMAILFPVLASARDSTFGSICMSNQRQLMVAVQSHVTDNKGFLPYGPEESNGGISSGADDFYVINGMVTSLITDKFGTQVGAGLMLDDYLSETPEVLFCPGTDQKVIVADELAKVGTDSAISGYLYRHGSNSFADLFAFRGEGDPLDDRIKLDKLGLNRNGVAATAIFADNNFILEPGSAFYNLFHRSNHDRAYANFAYADGHAEQRDNSTGRYEADITGTNLLSAISKMLNVLEEADAPQ
ncbi:MAG: type II secretion system protein [Phycisphaeraceae bacterium]